MQLCDLWSTRKSNQFISLGETHLDIINLSCTELCVEELAAYRRAFETNPANRVALNAVAKTTVKAVALNRQAVVRNNHTFSHMVKAGAVTSQNKSGRCWMFAGLNLFRIAAAEQMNLE